MIALIAVFLLQNAATDSASIDALAISSQEDHEPIRLTPEQGAERLIELYGTFPDAAEALDYFACFSASASRTEIHSGLPETWTLHPPEHVFPASENTLNELSELRQQFRGRTANSFYSTIRAWADMRVQYDTQVDACIDTLNEYVSVPATIMGRFQKAPSAIPHRIHPDAFEMADIVKDAYLTELRQDAWDYAVCAVNTRIEDAPSLPDRHSFTKPNYVNDPSGQERVNAILAAHRERWVANGYLDEQSMLLAMEALSADRYAQLGLSYCSERLLQEATTVEERRARAMSEDVRRRQSG